MSVLNSPKKNFICVYRANEFGSELGFTVNKTLFLKTLVELLILYGHNENLVLRV